MDPRRLATWAKRAREAGVTEVYVRDKDGVLKFKLDPRPVVSAKERPALPPRPAIPRTGPEIDAALEERFRPRPPPRSS